MRLEDIPGVAAHLPRATAATPEGLAAERAFLDKFFSKHTHPQRWPQRARAAVVLLKRAADEMYIRFADCLG
jgi:hypothetical protein